MLLCSNTFPNRVIGLMLLTRYICWQSENVKYNGSKFEMAAIPMHIVHKILDYLHTSETKYICKKRYQMHITKVMTSVSAISNFYHSRLLLGDTPYEHVTLHTLKRFYIVKYKPMWLQDFPEMAACCLGIENVDRKFIGRKGNYGKQFYQFCRMYKLDKTMFMTIGW